MVEDWVLRAGEKQCGWHPRLAIDDLRSGYQVNSAFRALCDLIAETQKPPMDPIEAAAREGCARYCEAFCDVMSAGYYREGVYETGADKELDCAITAIKVWIERGEGK